MEITSNYPSRPKDQKISKGPRYNIVEMEFPFGTYTPIHYMDFISLLKDFVLRNVPSELLDEARVELRVDFSCEAAEIVVMWREPTEADG